MLSSLVSMLVLQGEQIACLEELEHLLTPTSATSSDIAPGNDQLNQNEVEPEAVQQHRRVFVESPRSGIFQPSTPPPCIDEDEDTVHVHVQSPLASGPEETRDPSWQCDRRTVRERNACLFNNELMSDVTFLVGPKESQVRIPGHKYPLSISSPAFFAMFNGGLAESEREIELPDVEVGAFLTLLRYLYSDDIVLEADNVLATLYVAKKYLVPHLARACVEFLERRLTAHNACLLLSQSRLFEEPQLTQRCWQVIDAQAHLALASDCFTLIDFHTLSSILSRDTLNAKEISVFNAALKWARKECERRGLEVNPKNERCVLDDGIFLIRIPSMSLTEFANGPAQSGILTPEETVDIFLHLTAAEKPSLAFACQARTGLRMEICLRFQSCAYRSNQWRYRGRCDSIQFSVDRRIFIVGFGLYGSSSGAADYSVRMELKKTGRVLAENHTTFFSDGSSNTFRVLFHNPVQVEPDTLYTASVVLDGTELSFFGQDGLSEVCVNSSTNFQFQGSTDSTNGTGVQGGQIPEILFYGS